MDTVFGVEPGSQLLLFGDQQPHRAEHAPPQAARVEAVGARARPARPATLVEGEEEEEEEDVVQSAAEAAAAARAQAALNYAAMGAWRPSASAAQRERDARKGGWVAASQAEIDAASAEKSDPKIGEIILVRDLSGPQEVVRTQTRSRFGGAVEHVLRGAVRGRRAETTIYLWRPGSRYDERIYGRPWIYTRSRPGEFGRRALVRRTLEEQGFSKNKIDEVRAQLDALEGAGAAEKVGYLGRGGSEARRSSRRKNSTRKRRRGPVRRRTARKKTRQRKPKRTLSKRKKSRGTRRRNR
jgi:hypothetical protein